MNMADEFYQEMQDVASEVLEEFAQGSVRLIRRTPATPPDPTEPWVPGAPGEAIYVCSGAVRPVDRKFVDGKLVVGTERQATIAVRATLAGATVSADPQMEDEVEIDGRRTTIKRIARIPEAGVPVAFALVLAS